ncbi:MAG: prepilin-type N-terminal cleavage/methylation domain-containing protein [Patescibacteria group bacterium]
MKSNEPTSQRAVRLSGFSLLELLIYMAILAIAVLIISGTFLSLNRGRLQSEIRSEVNSNLRSAISRIAYDLKKGGCVVSTPATAGATSTSLIYSGCGEAGTATYQIASNRLQKTTDTGSDFITGDKVRLDNLLFTRLQNTNAVLGTTVVSIGIDMTIANNSASPDATYSASEKTTVVVR